MRYREIMEELYSVNPKATCHVTRQSKHQCTLPGLVPNLNSQASSPFREGGKLLYQIWKWTHARTNHRRTLASRSRQSLNAGRL